MSTPEQIADMEAQLKDPKSDITAADAKQYLSAQGRPSVDAQAEQAWAVIQREIKTAVLAKRSSVDVNLATYHNPALKQKLSKLLSDAGFTFVDNGTTGYIYW